MWTTENMPDLSGKTALVTGGNSGIGFETALALYHKGAHVIIASRDMARGEEAAQKITADGGKGSLEIAALDLSSLNQVAEFVEYIICRHQHLDVLINNAGIMIPPPSKTAEGYEMQFGVNFLGHFALTGHLYPLLKASPGARVVTLSSGAHHMATGVDYANLKLEKKYNPVNEYAVSKLADLLFMKALQRHADHAGDDIFSVGAHPGVTKTDLSRHMPEDEFKKATAQFGKLMPAWQGALPTLYAATSPEIIRAGYYGPDGENELRGYPAPARLSQAAANMKEAARLWTFAENATSIHFGL